MLDRVDEAGVLAPPLAPLDVGVYRLSLDRPGTDERDLHGQVVEVLGTRPQQALHLGAALDLEQPDRVGLLDLGVHLRVVEWDAREVDRLAVESCDQVDGLLDRREHPQAEQVDLEEAGVGAGVLVPLADLPARHRRRLYRHELDQRAGRDHHPARVLGEVARQACDLARELAEGAPARPVVAAGHAVELLGKRLGTPAVGDAGKPLELSGGQAERLAEVADRTAAAVGGKARNERGVLAAVALGEPDDEPLADVAREVEVDVGHGSELFVQEATERQVRRHRVDVGEAGQVADERADARAPASPRRQQVAWRVRAAHLERAGTGQLKHLPVQQEEAGEPEPVDQRQLRLEPLPCASAHGGAGGGVALGKDALAGLPQASSGRVDAVGEVGVAVAELLGEVEAAARGDLARAGDRVGGQPLGTLGRGAQHRLVVAATLPLGAVERAARADRDERVLQSRTAGMVGVDVTGRHRRHPERAGKCAECGVAAHVAALEGPLELDVEGPRKRLREHRRAGRVDHADTVPRAARQADDPLRMSRQHAQARLGSEQLALTTRQPRTGVRVGEDPAEVGVAATALA